MLSSLGKAIVGHVQSNRRLYLAISACYLLAIVFGAVSAFYVQSGLYESLSAYVNDLLNLAKGGQVAHWSVFLTSVKSGGFLLLFLWAFGFTVIGMPLIAVFVLYRGVSFGFTAAMLLRLMGAKGILPVLLLLLPHLLFVIPAYFFAACTALKMSAYLFGFFRGRTLKHNSFSSSFFVYTLSFLMPLMLLIFDAFFSAYAIPGGFGLCLSLVGG